MYRLVKSSVPSMATSLPDYVAEPDRKLKPSSCPRCRASCSTVRPNLPEISNNRDRCQDRWNNLRGHQWARKRVNSHPSAIIAIPESTPVVVFVAIAVQGVVAEVDAGFSHIATSKKINLINGRVVLHPACMGLQVTFVC